MRTYCEDPLKIHKKKITKDLRCISDDLFNLCKKLLPSGIVLCGNCRKKLQQNPGLIISEKAKEELLMSEVQEQSSTEFETSSNVSSPPDEIAQEQIL